MWNFDIFTVQNLGCIGVFSIEVEHFVVIKYFLITKKTEKILSPACFVNIILSLLWPSWFLLFPFTFLKHFSLFYENKILFSFSTLNSFLFKKKNPPQCNDNVQIHVRCIFLFDTHKCLHYNSLLWGFLQSLGCVFIFKTVTQYSKDNKGWVHGYPTLNGRIQLSKL